MKLYRFTLQEGSAYYVGDIGTYHYYSIDGLAFDSTGELYGINQLGRDLYRIYNGRTTRICEIPGADILGIAFGYWKDLR